MHASDLPAASMMLCQTASLPRHASKHTQSLSDPYFANVVCHVLQLAAACLGMGDPNSEYRPPITFVVVQKRHHTRLFPARPNEGDRSGNIMPGQFSTLRSLIMQQ